MKEISLQLAAHAFYVLNLAVALVLGYGLFSRVEGGEGIAAWCKNLFRAGSRLVAALCGRSGEYSFSAECGARSSAFWRMARACVDFALGEGHCAKAAVKEQPLP